MKKSHKPIRMCIVCKSRHNQIELNRFQKEDKTGRSYYICKNCIDLNNSKISKIISKYNKTIKA